jgi:hypothetical protein
VIAGFAASCVTLRRLAVRFPKLPRRRIVVMHSRPGATTAGEPVGAHQQAAEKKAHE